MGIFDPNPREALQGLLAAYPEMQARIQRDVAPVGSVGAPGGILGAPVVDSSKIPGPGEQLGGLLAMSNIPILADVAGGFADYQMFKRDPESRTPFNFALAGAGLLPLIPGMTFFHGSPHKFDKFKLDKIGTGEGAQVYGHGLYFAEDPNIAGHYAQALGQPDSSVLKIGEDVFEIPSGLDRQSSAVKGYFDRVLSNRKISLKQRMAITDFVGSDSVDDAIEQAKRIVDFHEKQGSLPGIKRSAKEAMEALQDLKRQGVDWQFKEGSQHLYEVDIPDEAVERMLDWDAPLSEQPEAVKEALQRTGLFERDVPNSREHTLEGWAKLGHRGQGLYEDILPWLGKGEQEKVSEYLRSLGIPGIKYYDSGSRAAGKGTRNIVVFDESLIKTLKRDKKAIEGLLE